MLAFSIFVTLYAIGWQQDVTMPCTIDNRRLARFKKSLTAEGDHLCASLDRFSYFTSSPKNLKIQEE